MNASPRSRDSGTQTSPQLDFTGERIVPGKTEEYLFREHEDRYVFAAQYVTGKDVLDVACGTGVGTSFLRHMGARSLTGVDIDPQAVAYAKANYGDCEFAQCEATNLSLSDGSVDVVVSFETIEHLEDQQKFLEECRRVLRPDGCVICSTPNQNMYRWLGKNKYHTRELSIREFKSMIAALFAEVQLFSQSERSIPLFVLRRAAVHVFERVGLLDAVRSALRKRRPAEQFRHRFETRSASGSGLVRYRNRFMVQPIYLIAVARGIPGPAVRPA